MKNLKKLRLKKEYSQAQLAAFLKVGTSVVTRWEHDETTPTIAQIIKLCSVLDCRPALLFGCDAAADGDQYITIPVFEASGVTLHSIPCDSTEYGADFGIVLSEDEDGRLCAGDICFFVVQNSAAAGSTVLVSDDCYNCRIALYNEDSNHKIIALCIAMHRQI